MARENEVLNIANEGAELYASAMGAPLVFIDIVSGQANIRYSGWKLHVFSTEPEDVVDILNRIHDTVVSNNCPMKAGTRNFFGNTASGTSQHGKGITIYLPYEMTSEPLRRYQRFVHVLQSDLLGYNKRGTISGDNSIDGKIHYRYEYRVPPAELPAGGVSEEQVLAFYRHNQGTYKLQGMEDLKF